MQHIVVLAVSGRMLAQACHQLGYAVHVLDCFNDRDTNDIAQSTYKLSFSDSGFNEDEVKSALDAILSKVELSGVLIGSGVETCPDIIDSINLKAKIIGHSSDIFKRVHNAKTFFQALNKLQIPYPETVFSFPSEQQKTWLCKRSGSLGGQHISEYGSRNDEGEQVYFQAYEQGQAMSALFFIDKNSSVLLGLHKLFLYQRFQYAGAIRLLDNEYVEVRKKLQEYFDLLQNEFGLQGLCGIDFILSEKEEIKVLELNARPTATLGLYKKKKNMLKNHIQSFFGEMVFLEESKQKHCLGEVVVFAEENCKWSESLKDFDFISDIPSLNVKFEQGEPVCTLSASTSSAAETEKLLYDRRQFILSQLEII